MIEARKVTRANEQSWQTERKALFLESDLDKDGVLNKPEALSFFKKVRTLDGLPLGTASDLDRL